MYVEDYHSQAAQQKASYMSQHSQQQMPLRCANCDIDILWPVTVVQGKTYCCLGCAAGGPCTCDYSEYSSVHVSGIIYYGNAATQATQHRHSETDDSERS